MSKIKLYTIQVDKVGRKWIQAMIQGTNYWFKGQVLINDYTRHFQIGQIYQVLGVLENKGNSYGSKFEMTVMGLPDAEYQRYLEAIKGIEYLKEQEKQIIKDIRENFKRSKMLNSVQVSKLKQLGVFEKYREEIVKMEVEIREETERKRLENIKHMQEVERELKIRKEEEARKSEEFRKRRKEEEFKKREELRRKEEQLITFNSPNKLEQGSLQYKDGKVLRVVKSKWVSAESTGNEIYWEMNYGQDFFYNVYCEDVSNTVEGQELIKKERQREERVALKKQFNSTLEDIVKYMRTNGSNVKQEDIRGKEIFRLSKDWVSDTTVITVDINNNKVYYFNEIGSGGLDWSWDGKTILAADITPELRGKLESLISLKSKIEQK